MGAHYVLQLRKVTPLSFCTSENLSIFVEWVDSCLAHYLDVVYKVIHPHSQTLMKMFEKI